MSSAAHHALYGQYYYEQYRDQPYERSPIWLDFFSQIADRIVVDIGPESVLDAGCAMGFLVEALRDRGVDAYGVDISEYAIQKVREDIRKYCWQGSLTDPLPRRYDLIVSIEVLEHLPPADGERAIENLCAHTDDILFSSTPIEYKDATHVNVRQPDYWAVLFGRHGLFHDVDCDLSYISVQAARFRRVSDPLHRVISPYERRLWQLLQDNRAVRELLGEQQVQLAQLTADLAAAKLELAERKQQLEAAQEQLRITQEQLRAAEAEIRTLSFRIARRVRNGVRRLFPTETRRGKLLTRALARHVSPADR